MFLYVVSHVVNWLIELYILAICVSALLSWFPNAYHSRFGQWLNGIVAPYINIFERFIPPIFGLDFSPMIAIFVLMILENLLNRLFIML